MRHMSRVKIWLIWEELTGGSEAFRSLDLLRWSDNEIPFLVGFGHAVSDSLSASLPSATVPYSMYLSLPGGGYRFGKPGAFLNF